MKNKRNYPCDYYIDWTGLGYSALLSIIVTGVLMQLQNMGVIQ